MQFLRVVVLCVVGFCLSGSVLADVAPDNTRISPVTVLQTVSDDLIAGLKAHKVSLKSDPKVVVDLVNTIVMPHVNKDIMIKTVLGRKGYQEWKNADEVLKQTFETQFTDLVINTYVAALQSFNNEQVKVDALRKPLGNERRVRLHATIVNKDGPPVAMTYVFDWEENAWKIIDFSVEGISLIQSYQSQFQEILSNGGGLQHLVDVLSKHNAAAQK